MTDREQVYRVINGERAYQSDKWGAAHDLYNSIGDFLVYIDEYVRKAKEVFTMEVGHGSTLHIVRKITALGVACMEIHGAPPREGFEIYSEPNPGDVPF